MRLDDSDPAASPYCLMSVVAEVVRNEARLRGQGRVERDRQILERGVQILHAAVDVVEKASTPRSFENAFLGSVPPFLNHEAGLARADHPIYLNEDKPRLREEVFAIPETLSAHRVCQRCAVISAPSSRMFKIWARRDGFPMLLVEFPNAEPIPETTLFLSRFIISVLPDSGLSLRELGAELDLLEEDRRIELAQQWKIDLARSGPPRAGFNNSDPWYDGRSVVLNYTIVDAPGK